MNRDYKIVGYLAEWSSWDAQKIDAGKMTHINYAFALIKDGSITVNKPDRLKELNLLKQRSPDLKTLVSVGGWGADGFSDAALTEASRCRFADSAVSFMKNHGFDGVDLDWEYPCSSEAGIKSRAEDKYNFTLLLQKLRERLDKVGNEDHKHYLLTIAAGTSDKYLTSVELSLISESIDFINVMTYDFHHGLSTMTGHHANLYGSISDDDDRMSVDKAVGGYLKAGIPASRLILGCAFYGRGWLVQDAANHGLYELIHGEGSEYSYTVLEKEYINKNGFVRYWDASARAPYLWDGKRFITYEDTNSLEFKAAYIKAKGLGGAMFWEYTQDRDAVLLNKLYGSLGV